MVEFIVKAGIIIIGLYLILFGVISWIELIDTTDDDYEYCYNCKYGMCTEMPKSEKCRKWRERNEN